MKIYLKSLFSSIVLLTGMGVLHSDEAQPDVLADPPVLVEAPAVEKTEPAVAENLDLKSVYVIPIKGPIASPTLFIVRRGVKEATANGVDVVLLDMDTPGGELGVTLEIMQILDRFEGETITFINDEAISAGAFISVITDRIFMDPNGQIGAAEVVSGTGQEIPEGMKRKLQSYINAKVRVYTEDFRYRGDVMRAMTDPAFELTVEGEVLAKEGELLSLTAREATQQYGEPPENLLAEGIGSDIREVLVAAYGEQGFEIREFEITWSEQVAQFMQKFVPVLMGLGMLLLFIEFKTPNFGIIGGLGIALILMVFLSNYVAGLAGYEAILLFAIGVVLIGVELFILPGTLIFGFTGIALVLGSLVWSLADFWPSSDGIGFVVNWNALTDAGVMVILSTMGALIALVLLWQSLPGKWLDSKLVLAGQSPSPSPVSTGGAIRAPGLKALPQVGSLGIVETPLHPTGKVRIEGRTFEASAAHGMLDRGVRVQVIGYRSYSLLVDAEETEVEA
jgi:membrane-bound serine protease (ClpP class)